MSSKSKPIRHRITPPQAVILKGFRDEPLKLLAIFDRGDAIELAGDVADDPMPFHSESVFRFDADIYTELQKAANRSDRALLDRTWAQAKPFRRSA